MNARTLWSPKGSTDELMLTYTVGDDPLWDRRLLPWDVLGSLGHAEGLRASGILTRKDYTVLRQVLRRALVAVRKGKLVIEPGQEDGHTAVEAWLTRRSKRAGEQLHTGRSRNDQIAVDLRLYLKHALLVRHDAALALVHALLRFAKRHERVLLPGYTHQRRAMPSSIALWAGAIAEGLLDTLESLGALWGRVDRSPLGSAAGYGVPLPLDRDATARALGFAALDHNVAQVQNSRGKLEAAVLFWCTQLGHDLAQLSQDVILYSSEEFGYLELPAEFSTGSSIMPHKRNPDLFELTRGRTALLQGDLAAVFAISSKLGGGYHRDYQLLKEPLFKGLDRTFDMLGMMSRVVPHLRVNPLRCRAALEGGTLATDEVMRRVDDGTPFRRAYRDVARELAEGARFEAPSVDEIVGRRRSVGGIGAPGLDAVRDRISAAAEWSGERRQRFDRALRRLGGPEWQA